MNNLKVDMWGCVENCYESAMYVHERLKNGHPIAIPLQFGEMTMFHVSFVPLWVAIAPGVIYSDGSNRGVQINIDRISSYSLPLNSTVEESSYISEKWNIPRPDAETFLPFINTVLTGDDYFSKKRS